MSQPFDVYSDGFSLGTNGDQVHLAFTLSPSSNRQEQEPSDPQELGTVRMSMRQLRAITFLSWRLVHQMERDGSTPELTDPPNMPNVTTEEWRSFWGQNSSPLDR